MQINFLPLKNYNHIIEGNALTLDWKEAINTRMGELREPSINYIMGNPPFVGGMLMTKKQKEQIESIFPGLKGVGEIDYVCAWYKKACDFIKNTSIKVALVSTNSICQGQSVITFWKYLMQNYDIEINFAYKTFRWNSESNEKAKVHCVIVGFSSIRASSASPLVRASSASPKVIYDGNKSHIVSHINPYLIEGEDVFIEVRSTPICNVPPMNFGNMPRDGGGFILTEEEKEEIEKKDTIAKKYIHLYLGAEEFINNKKRYCIWLQNANPKDIKESKFLYDRVQKVKEFRLASKAASTRKMAETPTLFAQITQPVGEDYIIIPSVSSEKRKYVPIGFLKGDVISSNANQIIPNASLYHFGILTSNVHMAWMRSVAGRLKSDYRYSKDIVYNNFPWPDMLYEGSHSLPIRQSSPSSPIQSGLAKLRSHKEFEEHKKKIEETAKAILDARAKFPDSSLADLYDDTTMPDILRKAHRENDKAVLKSYGFKTSYLEFSEPDCVAELMKLYKLLIQKFL